MWVFLYLHEIWQISKHFAGTFHGAQTSYFLRVHIEIFVCGHEFFFVHLWILLKQEYLCSILQLADFYHLSMKIHEKNYHLVKVNALLKLLWYVNHICKQKKKSVRELRIWTKGQACLNQIAIFKNIHM